MLETGRLHLHGASFRFERGRWWVSLQGVAAVFHPARRSTAAMRAISSGKESGFG